MHEYCREELELHWAAAMRLQQRRAASLASIVRVAMHAGKSPYSTFLRKMQDFGKQLDRIMGIQTPQDVSEFFIGLKGIRFKGLDHGRAKQQRRIPGVNRT
jgi:hypothetical protein